MGFLGDFAFRMLGGDTADCPVCATTLRSSDGERFECDVCNDVYFMEDGELVASMHRGRGRSRDAGSCRKCSSSLAGADYTSPWEDGDNEEGYVTCRLCGAKN